MAKVRVTIAMTSDGFLPERNTPYLEWLGTDRQGFRRWRNDDYRQLTPPASFCSLIGWKEQEAADLTFYAEGTDKDTISLIHGLFAYHLVDEFILYTLPVELTTGIPVLPSFSFSGWLQVESCRFKNGIGCAVYRRGI